MELGAAEVEGETSNNPLYQLAEDYHLADIDDSKRLHVIPFSESKNSRCFDLNCNRSVGLETIHCHER